MNVLEQCTLIIAEQKRVFEKQAKRSKLLLTEKTVLYLDNEKNFTEIESLLKKAVNTSVALLSDTGMPVLFDPGKEVLDLCRKLKFQIRTCPSATSWATAASVSGFQPPFFIEGFLPQEKEARKRRLDALLQLPGHKVLLETPYRYTALVNEILAVSSTQPVFLAWEIATPSEKYFWGSISELVSFSEKNQMKKGEFILILKK